MKTLPLTLCAAAFLPAALTAQFDTVNIGASLGVSDDFNADVVSAFAVTFPDGSLATDIRIDSNGRVTRTVDGDASDFSQTSAEHLGLPQICAMWDDLSPQINCDVFFYTDANTTNITWINTVDFNGTDAYTFQMQLTPDGTITLVYDAACTGQDALVGVSDGSGVGGATDLTTFVTGVNPFESFGVGGFDLGDSTFQLFFSGAAAGYVTAITPGAGAPPTCPVEFPFEGEFTDTCASTNRAFEYTPDGLGGYSIVRVIGTFVDDSATAFDLNSLATGSGDDELYAQTLGFPFTFPGGQTVSDVFIDTNGRVLADNSDGSDFNPTVAECLTGAPGAIVPFGCDMSPQLGTFTFSTTASEAIVTMLNTPQFGETNSIGWQLVMRADNSFVINYLDVSTWRTGFGSTTDDVVAGCFSGTDGAGTDPGSSSHSEVLNLSNTEGTFYQFFDATNDEDPTLGPVLDGVGNPTLGGNLEVVAGGISIGAPATLFFGFADGGLVPLDILGIEGGSLCSSADVVLPLTVVGDSASFSLALPADPTFVNALEISLQVAYIAFGDTSFGAVLSNGLNATFPN